MKSLNLLAATLAVASAPALAGTLSPDHPDVLVCDVKAEENRPASSVFVFLSAIGENGISLYQALGPSGLTAVFDVDGNLQGPTQTVCGGMSLSELKAAGRTVNY